MRNMCATAVGVGMLLIVPAMGLASPNPASTAQPARHATKGIVKSVDATTLVITRSPKNGREMTFVLNSSTERDGNVTVGSTVEVRYRAEAKQRVAMVISVQGHKP